MKHHQLFQCSSSLSSDIKLQGLLETCPLEASNPKIRLRVSKIMLLIEEVQVQDTVMIVSSDLHG
jgi:hypothetical protein